jgi:hypothetical protein
MSNSTRSNKSKVGRRNRYDDDKYHTEEKRAKKKSSITLAFDKDTLDVIREEAETDGISINAKVNQILSKYAFFYKYVEKSGYAIIMPHTIEFIIENIEEEKWIDEIKSIVMGAYRFLLMEHGVRLSLDNIIAMFSKDAIYSGVYSGFSYYADENGHLVLLFRHDRGMKWSRILAAGYSHLLKESLRLNVSSQVHEGGLEIKILDKTPDVDRLVMAGKKKI